MNKLIDKIKQNKGLLEIGLKTPLENSFDLSLVYTPGVGFACKEIEANPEKLLKLTNKKNSVAIIAFGKEDKIPFAEFLAYFYTSVFGLSAYPLVIDINNETEANFILNNLTPNFIGFELSLVDKKIKKSLNIEQLKIYYNNALVENIYEFLKTNQNIDFEKFKINFNVFNPQTLAKDYSKMDFKEASIALREDYQGVIQTETKFETKDFFELTKCAEEISEIIKTNPEMALEYTIKGNLVGIISDGSAVLGLGNIGAEAGLPVMEGKAALFKNLGKVDAMPLCIKTQNIQEFITIVQKLTPIFGGVNLEDINAPRCFEIEQTLIETTDIPIFHDDQHGTSIVVLAGFLNALKLTKKDIGQVKVVMSGAGAAAQNVAKLLMLQGVKNLILTDRNGIVFKERKEGMNPYLYKMAEITNPNNEKGSLQDALKGADFLIGLSAGNIVTEEMIKSMNPNPVVFALANPTPEIDPQIAKQAGAFIVSTGRSDFANQINNSLAFPGLFRGVLDSKAKKITNEMKLAAAKAISDLVSEDKLSVDYIIPNALDKTVPNIVAKAVSLIS